MAFVLTIMRRFAERNKWVATPNVNNTLKGQVLQRLHFVPAP
jgi:hypothetical protein